MDGKIKLIAKRLKGEDGYKTFSLRINESLVYELDCISQQTGISRNSIISTFIRFGLKNYEIVSSDLD